MNEIFKITKDKNYLSEAIATLPMNCLFDKSVTGCGGTSVALESDSPYIICVPFVSLIENKIAQYPNERYEGEVYGFHGKNNLKRDLTEYLERVKIPKIMVTYDSLERLTKWIDPKEFYILIDELHLLTTEYSYRNEAIQGVLRSYTSYKDFTFMTATPIEKEFLLTELEHIRTVKAEWEDEQELVVLTPNCINGVKNTVIATIDLFLKGEHPGNAYFFINSVRYIKDIVETMGLTDENTRVIYSDNNRTKLSVKRGNPLDEPKKINFITATAFEGADFYDPIGVTYIVSDGKESTTLLDIGTKALQIAGRIRNSIYAGQITHFYSMTRYSHNTPEEMQAQVEEEMELSKEFVADMKGKDYQHKITGAVLYVNKTKEGWELDLNKAKIDMLNYKIVAGLYSKRYRGERLKAEYERNGVVAINTDITAEVNEKVKAKNTKKLSFKALVDALEKEYLKYEFLLGETPLQNEAFSRYPFLKEAIEILGFDEIKRMNYVQKNIKIKLQKEKSISEPDLIRDLFISKTGLVYGEWFATDYIKDYLQETYDDLGLKFTATGSDITRYFKAERSRKRIEGKQPSGYTILG